MVLSSSIEKNMSEKIMKHDGKRDSKVQIIAQEVELVRILGGNDSKARTKSLKHLNKWFLRRIETLPFTDDDFKRIWKGLFYCMWMSDKPLIQEECAEKISKLVHFTDLDTCLSFFKAGMFILGHEWSGIDQLRLDKFLMLVRKLLRETFLALKQHSFTEENINSFNEALSDTILNKFGNNPVGLFIHFNEIFMEELAKVTRGKIDSKNVIHFVQPFIKRLAISEDKREIDFIKKHIFNYLMRQSDVGLDYQEKYEAWKQLGFPGNINSMQKIKVDKNKDSGDVEEKQITSSDPKEKLLDPRAGRVDVEIPQIRFKAKDVAKALSEYQYHKKTSSQSRKVIGVLVKQFHTLANGTYPLGIKKIDVKDNNEDINIRKAANRLIKFDQKLLGKGKKRKRDNENDEKTVIEKKRVKLQEGKSKQVNGNIDCIFERNSGTWVVYEIENNAQTGKHKRYNGKGKSGTSSKKVISPNNTPSSDFSSELVAECDSPKAGSNPVKLFESPPEKNDLFPKTEWDESLQEGEYEICIPSKRYIGKLKKQANNKNKSLHELINTTLEKIRGKSKLSLDSRLVKDPFSKRSGTKKVKINTKLNKSQEVYEHIANVKSSPAIPYDSTKKPSKPVLKPRANSTPVNPFYKKQLSFN